MLDLAGSDVPFAVVLDRDVAEVIARGVAEGRIGVDNLAAAALERDLPGLPSQTPPRTTVEVSETWARGRGLLLAAAGDAA